MSPQINNPQDPPLQIEMLTSTGHVALEWGIFFTLVAALVKRFLPPQVFANLPAANQTVNGQKVNQGKFAVVTDSNTAVWGAAVAGGGANYVLALCDGTNWTVVGI